MSGLRTFLLARIGDDEHVARVAATDKRGHGVRDCDLWTITNPSDGEVHATSARVAAECDAKRRIVANALQPCEWVLRYLALPYADHPDYQQEWKP